MDFSEIIALGLVAVAVIVLFGRMVSKKRSGNSCCKKGCGGDPPKDDRQS